MALSGVSQTTSIDTENNNVRLSEKGDSITLVLHIDDAKLVLGDLLDYEKVGSLLLLYQQKDSINIQVIKRKEIIISTQEEKIENFILQIDNYRQILQNKDSEITIFLDRIKQLEKLLKKERRKKKIAIAAAVVGPVVTAIIMGILL